MKTTAVVLAGGSGSRMGSRQKKQYMQLLGKPMVCYSLEVFEHCDLIDETVLVCGKGEQEQCRCELVEKYGYRKVRAIVPGGRERRHSVFEGLKAAGADCATVLIHDGARPLLEESVVRRLLAEVASCHACVAAMPVKDTIKVRDDAGCGETAIPRERLWMVQTPQVFDYPLILAAYERMAAGDFGQTPITDDAMVLECATGLRSRLVEGSYENLKVTTPEDLTIAEALLLRRSAFCRGDGSGQEPACGTP